MDPITHSLAGGLIAHSASFSKRRVLVFCVLGAFPDIDVLFSFFGPWASMFQHRGLSHSLLGVVFQALIFSWAFQRWDESPGESFLKKTGFYSLPLIFHLFCDYLTSYGVPLLLPLTYRHFHGDIASALNLFAIVTLMAGFWLIKVLPHLKRRFVIGMWFGWILYLTAMFGVKYKVAAHVNDPGATIVSGRANPFNWSIINDQSDPNMYRCSHLNILTGSQRQILIAKPPLDHPVTVSRQDPLVKEFLEESRWPTVRLVSVSEGWQVDWGNILFSSRGLVRAKVRVVVSPQGAIIRSHRIFGFWDPPMEPTKS